MRGSSSFQTNSPLSPKFPSSQASTSSTSPTPSSWPKLPPSSSVEATTSAWPERPNVWQPDTMQRTSEFNTHVNKTSHLLTTLFQPALPVHPDNNHGLGWEASTITEEDNRSSESGARPFRWVCKTTASSAVASTNVPATVEPTSSPMTSSRKLAVVKCHITALEQNSFEPRRRILWRWSTLKFSHLYFIDAATDALWDRAQGSTASQTDNATFKVRFKGQGDRLSEITITELMPATSPCMIPPNPNPMGFSFGRVRHQELRNGITIKVEDLERVHFFSNAVELHLVAPCTPFISKWLPLTSHGHRWFAAQIFQLTDLSAIDLERMSKFAWQ